MLIRRWKPTDVLSMLITHHSGICGTGNENRWIKACYFNSITVVIAVALNLAQMLRLFTFNEFDYIRRI